MRWREQLTPWASAPWGALLIALGLTVVSYGVRSIRLYRYFHREINTRWPLCLRLMLQHNLYNNLMPMRAGEVSFPVLMSRYFDIPMTRSLPALLWFRVLDLHTLGLLVLLCLPMPWGEALSGLLVLLLLPVPWLLQRVAHGMRVRTGDEAAGSRIAVWIRHIVAGLPGDLPMFWSSWCWTIVNWVVKMLVFAWVLGLFIELPLAGAVLGAISGDLTSVLPVNGIAGAGSYEAGVVVGLLPFGVTSKEALAAAVNLHLFMLGATLLGGGMSLCIPKDPARE